MLEEAADELLSRQGATLNLIGGGFFVSESDFAVIELAEAVVAEGDAKDVRSEILEGGGAGADGFAVHHPVFFPDAGVDRGKQAGLFQFVTELGAEDDPERSFVDQKVRG